MTTDPRLTRRTFVAVVLHVSEIVCLEPGWTPPAWHCPRCGATMVIGPILSARQLATVTLGFDTS